MVCLFRLEAMSPKGRCVLPILFCYPVCAFSSILLVSKWTWENVKGSPAGVGGGASRAWADAESRASLYQHSCWRPCPWHLGRGGEHWSLIPWFLSWFEYLTSQRSTHFHSLGSRRHWDLGGPEGTTVHSGPRWCPRQCFARENRVSLWPCSLAGTSI